jgi:hypothetical protein
MKTYSKKVLGGISFIVSAALFFAIVLWVQAQIVPGTVTDPTFTPPIDVDLVSTCRWLTSNHQNTAPSGPNRPWISFQEAYDNGATGICKCNDSADPETAMTDLTLAGSGANYVGSFWTQGNPGPTDFATCDQEHRSPCTRDYFTYLACG